MLVVHCAVASLRKATLDTEVLPSRPRASTAEAKASAKPGTLHNKGRPMALADHTDPDPQLGQRSGA